MGGHAPGAAASTTARPATAGSATLAGIGDQHDEASKPVRSGSPRLGRFDSCAAPLQETPAPWPVCAGQACLRARPFVTRISQKTALAGVSDHRADDRAPPIEGRTHPLNHVGLRADGATRDRRGRSVCDEHPGGRASDWTFAARKAFMRKRAEPTGARERRAASLARRRSEKGRRESR